MKQVLCITTGEVFPSVREAAKKKEIVYSALYGKINFGRCTVAGLEFEYTDRPADYNSQTKKNDIAKYGAKAVICLDTGEEFPSSRSAAEYFGLYQASVSNCCRGAQKTAGGKVFAYKGEEYKKHEVLEEDPKDRARDHLVRPLILNGVPDYYIAKIFGRNQSTMKAQLERIRKEVDVPNDWRMFTDTELEDLCDFIGIRPAWLVLKAQKKKPKKSEVVCYKMPLEEVWQKYGKPGENPTRPNGTVLSY